VQVLIVLQIADCVDFYFSRVLCWHSTKTDDLFIYQSGFSTETMLLLVDRKYDCQLNSVLHLSDILAQ